MAARIIIRTESGVLDLFNEAEKVFYVTRQVHDLTNLETRNADFTKQIQIPATPNNLRILTAEDTLSSGSGSTETKVPCTISFDGIQIASTAWLLHTSTEQKKGINFLNIVILYGNFNLFDSILPGTIDQMNWADLDQLWQAQEIHDDIAFNETGIVYAQTDWYADSFYFNSDLSAQFVDRVGFWTYALEIITRIMAEAGYSLSIFSAPANFHDFAICCPIDKFVNPTVFEGVSIRSEYGLISAFLADGQTRKVEFDRLITDITGIWQPSPDFEYLFSAVNDITAVVTGDVTYTEGNPNNAPCEVRIFHNAAIVATAQFPDNGANVPFFLSANIITAPGDVVYVEIFAELRALGSSTITLESNVTFAVSTPDNEDRTVHVSEHLPKINKKEFLTAILTQFNMIAVTDDITKTVFLYEFDDLYTQPEQDWSDFLDVGSDIERFHAVDGYAQDSHLKYLASDAVRRVDADYIQKFNNEILALENTIIQQPYAASDNSFLSISGEHPTPVVDQITTTAEHVNNFGNGDIINNHSGNLFSIVAGFEIEFQVGDWITPSLSMGSIYDSSYRRITKKTSETSGEVAYGWSVGQLGNFEQYSITTFETLAVDARCALIVPSIGPGNLISISDGDGTVVNISLYKQAAFETPLFWSDIAQNTHYKNLFTALKTPERLKAWFNIPAVSFVAIEFRRPVYINHFNAFYYINKMEQYKVGQKVRVDLIRISGFIDE